MRPITERCRIVGAVRHEIASSVDSLIASSRSAQRIDDVETVASELIPLCDALGWIARRGPRTLASRRVGFSGRPLWMWGVRSIVERIPLGRVLILGTWNYAILLSGVQSAQALAAGNTVLLKPAPGSEDVTTNLADAFFAAGVPAEALQILDSSTAAAQAAISAGVDLVVLTGAASTGRAVLRQTAEQITPAIVELSGVDAVVVLPSADKQRVVDALCFGLLFNSGATCIGPRRVFTVDQPHEPVWLERLLSRLREADEMVVHVAARASVTEQLASAFRAGAVDLVGRFDAGEFQRSGRMAAVVLSNIPADHRILQTDLFAPVMSLISDVNEKTVIEKINSNRYRLAASVFGQHAAATKIAAQLNVGSVAINDLIAPTADPRLPFGGRGESGFGVTRGPEGLLAMTTPRVISTRRGRITPHLSPRNVTDAELLTGALQMKHASGFGKRLEGLRRLTAAARKRDR